MARFQRDAVRYNIFITIFVIVSFMEAPQPSEIITAITEEDRIILKEKI